MKESPLICLSILLLMPQQAIGSETGTVCLEFNRACTHLERLSGSGWQVGNELVAESVPPR